jgi:anti-sigma regulatory factor (Ser/Thr protein kinase)/Na+-translocating ferredoxin:NAD+ oxidoreductase RNF subunit RnfB
MTTTSYPIHGGDYEHAGSASRGLKELLRRIGADPAAIRRAMIAAYEAEMNVVIHAARGRLDATLDGRRLDVVIADEGPGIPDVATAMRPGYSTAPAAARELGFGAGMGLPNIKRHSDLFSIDSAAGGTTIRFTIFLRPDEVRAPGRHGVHLAADRCSRCMKCLAVCPTGAMRVRAGGPRILEHLCVDCAACMSICPDGAIGVDAAGELPARGTDAVLVVPHAIMARLDGLAGPARVAEVLREVGFGEVWLTDGWHRALATMVAQYAAGSPLMQPVISPACPAAINLAAARFPSLLGRVAPLYSPLEVIHEDLAGRRAVFVAVCPCERSVLATTAGPAGVEVIVPETLLAAVLPRLCGTDEGGEVAAASAPAAPRATVDPIAAEAAAPRGLMRVTGVRNVLHALEEMESGSLGGVAAIELYMCEGGCAGAPTLCVPPFACSQCAGRQALADKPPVAPGAPQQAAESAWPASAASAARGRAVRRRTPLIARAGLRLDADMGRAVEKLARIHKILRTLPGADCRLCGAPTCAALAEDIVMGRADGAVCVRPAEQGKGTP